MVFIDQTSVFTILTGEGGIQSNIDKYTGTVRPISWELSSISRLVTL